MDVKCYVKERYCTLNMLHVSLTSNVETLNQITRSRNIPSIVINLDSFHAILNTFTNKRDIVGQQTIVEPQHEKTNNLHMRKQRRRSAVQ